MASIVELKNLTLQHRQLIQQILHLTPVSNFNDQQKKESFEFYKVENQYIYLPLTIASAIFGAPIFNFTKINLDFTGKLRDYQIPVFEQSIKLLDKNNCCILGLHPGFGKTAIAARIACEYQLLTVILVPRIPIARQWVNTFEQYTTAKIWFVGENKVDDYNVIICMDQRWSKIESSIRKQVGLLVIDEAHMFCTVGHVDALLAFQPKYIIAETATLERDDELHQMIYALTGEEGIFIETTKKFTVKKILTNTKVKRKLNYQGKTDYLKLVHDTLFNDRRNDIICNIVRHHPDHSILILTSLVDHVALLYNQLKDSESCEFLCGKKQDYKDSRVLIGTTHKIGTGFDQASSCRDFKGTQFNLLILVCSIKKYQMLVQNVGRVLRSDSPTIYHFVDEDAIYHNHWALCQRWYKKRNALITTFSTPLIIDLNKNFMLYK